ALPKEDIEHLRKKMNSCLHSKGGEITARAQTVELGKTYLNLNETGRARFLDLLATDFDIDRSRLGKSVEALLATKDKKDPTKLESARREASTTPRSIILRRFNPLPDGFKFLVDMRADLMPLVSKNPNLQGLEYDLKNILSSWFAVGLLDLVEITWIPRQR